MAQLPKSLAPLRFEAGASPIPKSEDRYMFNEYPKWLYPDGAEPILVQNADDEAALASSPLEAMRSKLTAAGIAFDRRWGLAKLTEMLPAAE